jgi:murein DD-endopeptidase MepM/ murein hydrolase activator NlpD
MRGNGESTMKQRIQMKSIQILAAALGAMMLSACAPDFNPPPDYQGGYLWNSDRSRTVTVAEGDSLYAISRRYDVPTKVIADRNGLAPPYALTVGQTLILDPTRVHVAANGDTMASIAQQYGVDQGTLAAANELPAGTQLRPGTQIWIPDPFTSAAAPARNYASAGANAVDLPPVTAAPRNTRPITSENLPPLPGAAPLSASAFGTGAAVAGSVAAGTAGAIAEAPLSALAAIPSPNSMLSPRETMIPAAPPAGAPQSLTPAMPETNMALAVPKSAVAEPSTSGARFTWPITGAILARFGAAGKGLHNDGINIAAPAGTQVRAAGPGVVAYAGNELKGFGNLLLIKHADGWTTAYAHNEKLLVAKGDTVVQGQVIANVGRTGNVDRPQLHFEVRKGTQALDPLSYLVKAGG